MSYNLQQRLNAFVSGECSSDAFLQELVALCDTTPDFAWDVLSLVDQYHRRGKLSAATYRTITHRIEQRALFFQGAEPIRPASVTRVAVPGAKVANDPAIVALTQPRTPPPPVIQPANTTRPANAELARARVQLQRYRHRIATLADVGRRYRRDLGKAQDERAIACARSALYLERLKTRDWRRTLRTPPARVTAATVDGHAEQRPRRQVQSLRAASWIALILVLGVLPRSRESPPPAVVAPEPPPEVAAPLAPAPEPGLISLSDDRYVVLPGQAQATFAVHRTNGGHGNVSFEWRARGSGAKPGKDFIFGKPRLEQLPDGVESLQLSIPIVQNPSRKHTELFYVELRKPGNGASLGAIKQATIIIMRPD